jgi:hypothetical protein
MSFFLDRIKPALGTFRYRNLLFDLFIWEAWLLDGREQG